MKKNILILIITIFITALVVGGGIYWWQQSNVDKLKSELQQQIDGIIQISAEEKNDLNNQISILNSKINNLDLKIKEYLEAQGKKCETDTEICLDDLTKKLTETTGPDCSTISDDTCPNWCAAGSDYDCCIEKGYEWISGRGCWTE